MFNGFFASKSRRSFWKSLLESPSGHPTLLALRWLWFHSFNYHWLHSPQLSRPKLPPFPVPHCPNRWESWSWVLNLVSSCGSYCTIIWDTGCYCSKLSASFLLGTHYFRGINNNSQPWCNWNGRKKLGLKPINPTEEGLASIHSVLFRKDPFLWRAALLYYTVYQASQMSFSQLFQDVGRFVKDPNTRWDYCVRAKRGWTDTSQPGWFPV